MEENGGNLEEAILACIITSPLAIEQCTRELNPEVFEDTKNKLIYLASIELYHEFNFQDNLIKKNRGSHPCDLYHLINKLTSSGVLEKAGGINKLTELQNLEVIISNLSSYVKMALENWQRRCLSKAGEQISKIAKDVEKTLDQGIQESRELIEEVSSRKPINLITIEESGYQFLQQLDDITPIYDSVLSDLNGYMIGYEPGKSYVIAARTSMGKTQLALYESFMMALRHKVPVIYFSLEMSRSELDARIFAFLTHYKSFEIIKGIPHLEEAYSNAPKQIHSVRTQDFRLHRISRNKTRKPYLTEGQRETLNYIQQHIYPEIPFSIDDEPNMTMDRMYNHIKKMQTAYNKSPLVVIDYVSMISDTFDVSHQKGNWSRVSRSQELKEIVYRICELGKKEETPMILLSQVNRDPETRADKRPLKSDLRECGSIEERVDGIMLLYRDEYYYPDDTEDRGILEINVAKNRQGKTGVIKAKIDLEYGIVCDREKVF